MSNKIDVVLPYVDSYDRLWALDYINTTHQYSPSPVRFRSWGTLKYLVRAIAENLSFVDQIILVVARESQVPDWINPETVRVVYHSDFIPEEYLPTFNSCTIEAFLPKISGISEKFIYFNDDLFPINSLSSDDFFTEDRPNLQFQPFNNWDKTSIFRSQILSSVNMIADRLNLPRMSEDRLIVPHHAATPMLKSSLDQVMKVCGDNIDSTISALRDRKNINQYIYSYYQYFTKCYIPKSYDYTYAELSDDLTYICNIIMNSRMQMLCLNDSASVTNYKKTSEQLCEILNHKFPNKCKYER